MDREMESGGRPAERALVLSYAADARRDALATLLELDDRLARLATVAREPMLAQMRLAWWHDALDRLDAAPPPAEPLLTALAAGVITRGITGAALAAMVDGWEVALDPDPDDEALGRHAAARGGGLFAIAARLLGDDGGAIVRTAGEGWALADLSRRLVTKPAAERAVALARARWADGPKRWSRALRPLGALALLAQADLAGIPPGAPRRVGRLAWHRLTGR